MRWLVTGSAGMLGTDLVDLLQSRGADVTAAVRATADLHDPEAVRTLVAGHDVVVNCAAWTAVDDAESHEAEALEVNGVVPDRHGWLMPVDVTASTRETAGRAH